MKHRNTVLFLLMAAISLCSLLLPSCSQVTEQPLVSRTDETTTRVTEPIETVLDTREEWSAEIAVPTYIGIDNYNALISKYRMPEDFVYYEELTDWGEFSSLVYPGPGQDYAYELKDDTGAYIFLAFSASSSQDETLTRIEENSDDMRTLQTAASGCRHLGSNHYIYYKGELARISLSNSNYHLDISVLFGFAAYDTTSDTPLARLLNRSTAQAEANAIFEAIGNEAA